MFRFGDGTPFPLRENFIETLVAVIDCCVAIYQVEAQVEEHHAHVRDARRHATDELRRLDALHGLIETAIAPLVATKEQNAARASAQAAAKIFEASSAIIRSSRAGVNRRRESAEQEVVPPDVLAGTSVALGQFFARHQLPGTEWQARWAAGADGPATAEIGAYATRELELLFRAALPPDVFWSRPIPMAELLPGPVAAVNANGRGRRRQVRLDPMNLTELHLLAGHETMVLRESGKRPGSGLHIAMPRAGEATPLVTELDKHDQSRAEPFYLDDDAARAVFGAWRALHRELPQLIASRQELTFARLAGRNVSELEHPAQVAEAILMSVAPLVREMRLRSRVPGELALKRDLGPDRREELFVPRRTLWNKLAVLSPPHRQLFEAIGLNDDATMEFARTSDQVLRPPMVGGRAHSHPEVVDTAAELPMVESYGFEHDPHLIDPARTRQTPPPPPGARGEPIGGEFTGDLNVEGEVSVEEVEIVSGVEIIGPDGDDAGEAGKLSGVSERATG